MEVHQLRYFCAIVKQGTFTRAAISEHVAQPSLSQQIFKLEDELDGKLFYRLPKGARLTPLGESLLPHALAILQQIQDAKAECKAMAPGRRADLPEIVTTMAEKPDRLTDSSARANERGLFALGKSA